MQNLINLKFAKSDAFGMVPKSLRFLQPTIEAITPFDDAAVSGLRSRYSEIEIDRCIRAHIANITDSEEMQVSQEVLRGLEIYPDELEDADQVGANARIKFPFN
jgi:hypothetical protein